MERTREHARPVVARGEQAVPIGVARDIYRAGYWDLLQLDEVASSSCKVALELFDTAVNCGQATAAKYLQRALNAFNHGATDYPDVRADGLLGPVTVDALRRYMKVRGFTAEAVMLRALNAQQGAGYLTDAELRPKDEKYVYGWFANRIA